VFHPFSPPPPAQFVPQPHTLWRTEEQVTKVNNAYTAASIAARPAAAAAQPPPLPPLATSQEALESLHSRTAHSLPETLESPPAVPANPQDGGRPQQPMNGGAFERANPQAGSVPLCKYFVNSGICYYGAYPRPQPIWPCWWEIWDRFTYAYPTLKHSRGLLPFLTGVGSQQRDLSDSHGSLATTHLLGQTPACHHANPPRGRGWTLTAVRTDVTRLAWRRAPVPILTRLHGVVGGQ
jgi:hypothetical protein